MLREPARSMAGFEVRGENIPRRPCCGWQLVPWVRDDTFLQGAARRGWASGDTSASCASAATAACCCWSSAWAR